MNLSPMQPHKFWLQGIQIFPNQRFVPTKNLTVFPQLSINAGIEDVLSSEGNPGKQCNLSIQILDNDENIPPYLGVIVGSAIFVDISPEKLPADDFQRLVAFNGLALVYSFIRDTVVYFTNLGPYGTMILPAVNITEFSEQLLKAPQQPKASAAEGSGSVRDTSGATTD